MKMQIVGFEGVEDISKKTGKPYSMGQIHTVAPLAPSFSENGISKGLMGTTFRCSVELIQKIKHLQPPFMGEVSIDYVMRFGKREEEVTDITSLGRETKSA